MIPQTVTGIKVACFEISQDPGSKTDYRHIIAHDSLDPALTARLERELTAVHRSLASKLPRRDVIVLFPSRDPASDQPLFCLCRCATIDRAGSRPILRLQAIVGSPAQARSEGADLLDLCDSPVWTRISETRIPVAAAASVAPAPPPPENGTLALIEQAANALRQRNADPLVLEIPDDNRDWKRAKEVVRSAIALLNDDEFEGASLGIGIPAGCTLPTRPALIVPEPAASAGEPAPRGLPDSYLFFLRRLAVDVSECPEASALWRQRLWNKTQDLLAMAEEFGRRASPAARSAPVGMRSAVGARGMVRRRDVEAAAAASQELGRELGHAGMARKIGDLEKQTATFLDYLLPSVKDDPRPRDARPLIALLIVLAAIGGALIALFWHAMMWPLSTARIGTSVGASVSTTTTGSKPNNGEPATAHTKAKRPVSHPVHPTPSGSGSGAHQHG